MGIIERQATRTTIYSYLGAVLGFVSITWMSHLLTTDENGLIRILISVSALFAQFASLGFSIITSRLFPYFRNKEKGHHGFLFYALFVSLIGFGLCWIVFSIFKDQIIAGNIEKSKLFVDYLFYLMPLTFFTLFFNVFDNYLRAGYNSVIGSFIKEFFQRVLIIILLVLFFLKLLSFSFFIFAYIASTCLPTLILMFYIIKQGEWHIKPVSGFMTKELRIKIIKLSLFSIFAGFSSAIVMSIDSIMVNNMLGLSKTGIYSIAFFFGSLLSIPARSINRITSSIVAEAFMNDNIGEIKSLYNKTCNSQFAIGILLFIGIWVNIDNIIHLLPQEYSAGKNVILFVSAGYMIDMATGINQTIIGYSKYYYVEIYFIIITVVLIIISNYILIPIYDITGSAVATAFTITFGNLMRFLFLKIKMKMQPYDMNSVKLIIISVIALLPGYFMPYLNNLIIDIAIRSSIVGGIFILLILKMEATPELNSKIRKNLKRFSINI